VSVLSLEPKVTAAKIRYDQEYFRILCGFSAQKGKFIFPELIIFYTACEILIVEAGSLISYSGKPTIYPAFHKLTFHFSKQRTLILSFIFAYLFQTVCSLERFQPD
jgi:hypothetical protein